MTAEDWAPYGKGTPDADGWYPDYRTPPESVRPEKTAAVTSQPQVQIDESITGIVTHWRIVVAELAERFHVDLYDPAVRARPWPGVRTMIFTLLQTPGSRLREALIRR